MPKYGQILYWRIFGLSLRKHLATLLKCFLKVLQLFSLFSLGFLNWTVLTFDKYRDTMSYTCLPQNTSRQFFYINGLSRLQEIYHHSRLAYILPRLEVSAQPSSRKLPFGSFTVVSFWPLLPIS
jgi:hypothetical protein